MKPDVLVYPITDTIFVSLPDQLTPEVTNPVIGGQLVEGKVLIAARAPRLAAALQDAVDQCMQTMPKPAQVQRRVVTRAEWSLFTDPAMAEAYELPHDCDECREGQRMVVDFLHEHPGQGIGICKLVYDEYIEPVRLTTADEFIARGTVVTGDVLPEAVAVGEQCSMCHHPLDPHELWLYGLPDKAPPGRMTCPVEGCGCESSFGFSGPPM